MENKIVRLEPHTMAVFLSMDANPGFYVKLCNEGSLVDAVRSGLFMREATDEDKEEVARVVDGLRASGYVDFEDGWIALRIGMADVTSFVMEKLCSAKQDEHWADEQRYKELKARQDTEARYEALRSALVDALGSKAGDIAAHAAA